MVQWGSRHCRKDLQRGARINRGLPSSCDYAVGEYHDHEDDHKTSKQSTRFTSKSKYFARNRGWKPARLFGLQQERPQQRKFQQTLREGARRRKGTISCVLVVFIFVAAWFPRAFYNISRLGGMPDKPVLTKISLFLLFLQSSVNPFIYSFYRNDFRRASRALLKRLKFWWSKWITRKFFLSKSEGKFTIFS